MPIRGVELMHGAVLEKLCRSDKPVTLRLIETQDDLRSAYWINDVVLYMKHSITPYKRERKGGERWQFNFTESHIADLASLVRKADIYLVLICGRRDFEQPGEIALLKPDEWQNYLDLAKENGQQWLAVQAEPRKSLRVYGSRSSDEIVVPRNRLEEWIVPGS